MDPYEIAPLSEAALGEAYRAVDRASDRLNAARGAADRCRAYHARAQAWRMLSDQLPASTLEQRVIFRAVTAAAHRDIDMSDELKELAVTPSESERY